MKQVILLFIFLTVWLMAPQEAQAMEAEGWSEWQVEEPQIPEYLKMEKRITYRFRPYTTEIIKSREWIENEDYRFLESNGEYEAEPHKSLKYIKASRDRIVWTDEEPDGRTVWYYIDVITTYTYEHRIYEEWSEWKDNMSGAPETGCEVERRYEYRYELGHTHDETCRPRQSGLSMPGLGAGVMELKVDVDHCPAFAEPEEFTIPVAPADFDQKQKLTTQGPFGEEILLEDYSVNEYLHAKAEEATTEEEKELTEKVIAYGEAAGEYFHGVGDGAEPEDILWDSDSLPEDSVCGAIPELTYLGTSLECGSTLLYHIYFALLCPDEELPEYFLWLQDSWSIPEYSISCEDQILKFTLPIYTGQFSRGYRLSFVSKDSADLLELSVSPPGYLRKAAEAGDGRLVRLLEKIRLFYD